MRCGPLTDWLRVRWLTFGWLLFVLVYETPVAYLRRGAIDVYFRRRHRWTWWWWWPLRFWWIEHTRDPGELLAASINHQLRRLVTIHECAIANRVAEQTSYDHVAAFWATVEVGR